MSSGLFGYSSSCVVEWVKFSLEVSLGYSRPEGILERSLKTVCRGVCGGEEQRLSSIHTLSRRSETAIGQGKRRDWPPNSPVL